MKSLITALLASAGVLLGAQEVYKGCGKEGDTPRANLQALNRLKNRDEWPEYLNVNITLKALLAPGDDRTRWKVRDAAELTGYCVVVKPGGKESCNCHAADLDDRDTHIELALDPMDGASKRVVVEVTPRIRAVMARAGIDWSTSTLRARLVGRWVKVQGWMFFDSEHVGQSENTAPGRDRNWRATAWECHPLTSIEVVDRPR